MGKRVVVIASGETERRSLPHLLAHLRKDGIELVDVRIPPRHRALGVDMAESLVKASFFARVDSPPDKFVVLVDADGKPADDVLSPLRNELPARIATTIPALLQFACAQWHLEAWFFADPSGLRKYLGQALGNVDTSAPDTIQNPKLHLKHLLGARAYTSAVSEGIAKELDAQKIWQKSQSFKGFVAAVRNGQLPLRAE